MKRAKQQSPLVSRINAQIEVFGWRMNVNGADGLQMQSGQDTARGCRTTCCHGVETSCREMRTGKAVMSKETQQTISGWANATFGAADSNARVAARANEEMAELIRALTADDQHPKAAEEIADVVIILYRLAERLGVDLMSEIDRKMEINRSRKWNLDSTGHGYHVRDK